MSSFLVQLLVNLGYLDASADGVVAVSDLQQTGTITVGVDDTGHDVKFFGAICWCIYSYTMNQQTN